jgi:hypothetical protein
MNYKSIKIFLAVVMIFVISLGVVPQFAGNALADCYCKYKTIPDGDGDTSNDGILVQDTTVDSRTCFDVFGRIIEDDIPGGPQITTDVPCDPYSTAINVGWQIPTFSQLLGNVIRLLFFIAGLVTLAFLLLGGFEWVQSGGDEKKVEAARKKITSSVIGLVVMIAVLSLVIFLEQVVFGGKICLGISCPMNINFLKLVR